MNECVECRHFNNCPDAKIGIVCIQFKPTNKLIQPYENRKEKIKNEFRKSKNFQK